jgi:hypothetical protein
MLIRAGQARFASNEATHPVSAELIRPHSCHRGASGGWPGHLSTPTTAPVMAHGAGVYPGRGRGLSAGPVVVSASR